MNRPKVTNLTRFTTMVLAELGGKLRDSLRKLHSLASSQQLSSSASLTQSEFNKLLNDITRALMEADVNVKLVLKLRDNIKAKVQDLLPAEDDDDEDDDDEAVVTDAQASRRKAELNRRRIATLTKTVQRVLVDELVALLSPKGTPAALPSTKSSSSKSASSSMQNSSVVTPYTMRRGQANIILFVGLQGAGKTTTVAKVAHYYQRRGWKTCMVCADTFRAGALDQLKQNATKLRIPFYGSYTQPDPVVIAEEGVQQFRKDRYEVILVDTSGRHKQEDSLFTEMQEISAAVHPDNVVLVMDATQGQAVYDQALAFHQAVDVGSVIITKLDGHAKGGGALSAVAATGSPIIFLGEGEHFDDLDPFNAQSFVSKLLGFGDVQGLVEAMKGMDDHDGGKAQNELMEKMSKGEFTLRDMYNQFQKVMNMGPLNKLVGMLPGMPEYLIPKSGDQEATHRLRKFMIMMDSMNNAELDGKVDMHKTKDPNVEARIKRIAAGSGCHPNEVKMLLLAHKQFESMVSKMGKSGLIGKQAQARQAQLAQQMRKNPNLIQQRLNQMDPKLLQQMGGRENVMAMMQQMARGGGGASGAGGGMPNMDALMGSGGIPGMGGMPGMGGTPGMGGLPGLGGMDMETVMKMAQSMGMGGMPGMGSGPPPRR